jgi:2-haloacid dehalogenase
LKIEALLFDVFGTVVDWRTSLIGQFDRFGRENSLVADWATLVDDWRAHYEPSMAEIRAGKRAFLDLDQLHQESLEKLLPRFGLVGLTGSQKERLVRGWHLLDPWPDAVRGLNRMKQKHIIGTLSNGGLRLLADMAKYAGLPWDVILSADIFRYYKPDPQVYLGAAALLNTAPENIMLVAAHNYDLQAARKSGFRTAFVARPSEYGPRQSRDFSAESDWDYVASDFEDLAGQLETG